MRPYILLKDALPDQVVHDLKLIKRFLEELPDAGPEQVSTRRHICAVQSNEPEYLWSCHGLTRAAAGLTNGRWTVLDGFFMRKGSCHSWLYLNNSFDRQYILDVYPIAAIGGPILLDVSDSRTPWADAYIENSIYYRDRLASFTAEAQEALDLWNKIRSIKG